MRTMRICLWLVLTLPATGCQSFCAVEQWKCDRFGWCNFGTQPRRFGPPVYDAPLVLPPATNAPPYGQPGGPVIPPNGTFAPDLGQPAVPAF